MALKYTVTSVVVPGADFTATILGDGSSTSIKIPLTELPLNFNFGLGLHNPDGIFLFTGCDTCTLGLLNFEVTVGFTTAPANNSQTSVSVYLRYAGV
jgi:hypothetical protein